MRTAIACLLVSLVYFSPPAGALALLTVLPDASALSRAESAFELRPGVVVDPIGGMVYLMSPEGGIEKVSVASGEVLWSTTEAAKPLALYGDLLIAQSERADAAGVLEIVLLDSLAGGERRAALPIALPPGVWGVVDEGMGRSLVARAAVRAGEPRVTWEYTERYVKGVAPQPDEPLERRQSAFYRLDFSIGKAVAADDGGIASATLPLPANVQAWADSGVGSTGVVRAGNVLAATQAQRERGRERITLKRWDAASGVALPDVEIFRRPHILEFASADGRHLLVSERANPGDFAEYEWSIFSLETGENLGQVSHHFSHSWFFVSGKTLVYVERPYGHLVGEEWVDEPRKVKAILLGSVSSVWERPLRDTTYRGPFPP